MLCRQSFYKKGCTLIHFFLKCVPPGVIDNMSVLELVMIWHCTGAKPRLHQCWLSSLINIFLTWPQCVDDSSPTKLSNNNSPKIWCDYRSTKKGLVLFTPNECMHQGPGDAMLNASGSMTHYDECIRVHETLWWMHASGSMRHYDECMHQGPWDTMLNACIRVQETLWWMHQDPGDTDKCMHQGSWDTMMNACIRVHDTLWWMHTPGSTRHYDECMHQGPWHTMMNALYIRVHDILWMHQGPSDNMMNACMRVHQTLWWMHQGPWDNMMNKCIRVHRTLWWMHASGSMNDTLWWMHPSGSIRH